ncbi:Toluene tolerance pump ttgGHI operon repressor (plasmid) [Variovorax sp. SRS16]|uniref:IclR family transcriptional regulator n=1 Tax=Variovorax sp. SRS16 TaxID=282217 RepID=UPI0013189FF1|nr:helix-turn-helix domain-containing protein [Variovorax sp. SRS16]VTU46330.1 Toluene tolerance pump ttgGHI operon repressor [Variovorax sp. SRS16]
MSLQTIDRAAQLLTELGKVESMRLIDMQRALSLSKPTVHRLVQSLMKHKLVERAQDAPLYRLGSTLPKLAQRGMPPINGWHDACRPALRRLAAKGHPASLLARIGLETLCIETLGGTSATQAALHVGLIVPLGAGSAGVSILGDMEDDDIAYVLRTMGPRIRSLAAGRPRDLPEEIHCVRRQGYAVVPDMLVKGMAGVSAVLHDGAGRPLGAFGLLLPSSGLHSPLGRGLIDTLRRERDWAERALSVRLQ